MSYRLGIDVGGTNTDAVILDRDDRVVSKCKKPTTEDISTGLKKAVDTVLSEGKISPDDIIHQTQLTLRSVHTSLC